MELDKHKLERLVELASILGRQNDYQEILRVVAQKSADFINAEAVVIMMINPRTRQSVKTLFKDGQETGDSQYRQVQKYVSGWIIKHNQPFMSSNIKTDDRFTKNLFRGIQIQSVVGVPLQIEGIIIGTLILLNSNPWSDPLEQVLFYLERIATIATPYVRNVQKIQQYFEVHLPETALRTKYKALGLLGKSKSFIKLLQAIEAAARCDVRVLLVGQSGTGKELVARAIHKLSSRSDRAFVAIDCGAIPANLIESELFGHVKGAFTGAGAERKGLLQEADKGTLFMDEIASLPLDMQAKFMRVLQEGEFRPLGSNKTRKVDVRIISATSLHLRKLVDSHEFREDLFYRLHVYPIQVPSLNDRQKDIPLLADCFLRKFAAQQQKRADSFHEEIMDFFTRRHWPGNVRELENTVERLVTLTSPQMKILNRDILPQDLRTQLKKFNRDRQDYAVTKSLNESLSEYEEQLIREALMANYWNQSKTARVLKISEQTLRYKMSKLGIVRPKSSLVSRN